ncbi:hypothetical protein PHYPSEUDO_001038 [Phytophthora pseudosyringae]|uniref:PWWP domain-containing protein n=1 Tax=Phytophthora pseudosyringae TaxID=221518 RepID=A0A8T1W0V2_9STRA|nr:hypothetical protein PHYPSEUDO_001038 [Phytophthora pseudosyringae]
MPRPVTSPRADLHAGDWLDVMDLDGIWSVARVLSVPSPDTVEITYDGWPSEYDEVVGVDSDRVAPFHTFTWAAKCWLKHLNWPLWPSVVTIRSPGTEAGMRNLNKENKLQVDFMDSSHFGQRARCWLLKGHVKPFDEKHDQRRQDSNGSQFEQAYGMVLQSNAEDPLPKFVPRGTLPVTFKETPAESVETKRREMGEDEWFASFAKNQALHQLRHQYSKLGGGGEDAASVESADQESATECKTAAPTMAKPKRAKLSTKAKPAVKEDKPAPKPKRPRRSKAAKREEEETTTSTEEEEDTEGDKPKRPKLSTAVGHEKTARKGKRTKLTTAVKRVKALPISSNRRLLCVKK